MAYDGQPIGEEHSLAEAKHVLAQYTLDAPTVTFVQHNAGVVWRVDAEQGRFMLKLHQRVGSGTNLQAAQLETGMRWLHRLARDTGMVVQTPMANVSGQYVSEVEGAHGAVAATLQRWVEGRSPHGDFTTAQLRETGRVMARLHSHSAQDATIVTTPSIVHDTGSLRNHLTTLRANIVPHVVSADRFDVVEQAVGCITSVMDDLGTDPSVWGAIHGGIHHDNVLFDGDDVRLIDFDGVRLGHYMYDVGVTMYHILYQDAAIRRALLDGYGEVRMLPHNHERIIEVMISYAALDNLAWNSAIPSQLDAPLFRRNVAQFVDLFCASLVAGRSFLWTNKAAAI